MGKRGIQDDDFLGSRPLHTRERRFDIQIGRDCPLDERIQLPIVQGLPPPRARCHSR
jgi:hypothetical protein